MKRRDENSSLLLTRKVFSLKTIAIEIICNFTSTYILLYGFSICQYPFKNFLPFLSRSLPYN